jgi:hypothetical protein
MLVPQVVGTSRGVRTLFSAGESRSGLPERRDLDPTVIRACETLLSTCAHCSIVLVLEPWPMPLSWKGLTE